MLGGTTNSGYYYNIIYSIYCWRVTNQHNKNVGIGKVVTVANYNVQVTLPTPITG